jgi:hypothetical protein
MTMVNRRLGLPLTSTSVVRQPDFVWGRVALYARQCLKQAGVAAPDVEFTLARWMLERPLFVLP